MGHVTCPFCRTAWDYGDAPKMQKVNIAFVKMPERGAGYRNGSYTVYQLIWPFFVFETMANLLALLY